MHKLSERNVYTEKLFLARSCKILQKSCKNAIASKKLALIDFFVTILQDFLNLLETYKILQELNFLSTKVLDIPQMLNSTSETYSNFI